MSKPGEPLDGGAFRSFEEAMEAIRNPRIYACRFDESDRQLILMALQLLRIERPGFDYALGEIEQQFGGQIQWPPREAISPFPVPACLLYLIQSGVYDLAYDTAAVLTDLQRRDLDAWIVVAMRLLIDQKNRIERSTVLTRMADYLRYAAYHIAENGEDL